MPDNRPPDAVPPPPPVPPPVPPPLPRQGNQAMLVLSYLGLLALVPLLVEKNDREVQWHAKHGLVLTVLFVAVFVALNVMSVVIGFFWLLSPLVWLLWLVVTVLAIVKALDGKRFLIPGISELADKF
ncbi:DUF4870 domain-containing protein [Acidobacteria bacterium ACD]|nr:MAG: DUF4870 domain-containing protein [Acidobacteriota bacterium]MCE7959611.1 DUF4870 domain-containing protein [Acidobacteria bacterium ACB2]MDL1951398.1 DUF4870 domain-containing protein [Acidobacteria bacterium ACD]